eukprot:SAG31_NODE_13964_length_834_cov_1.496599_1_plen_31_part_01
MYLGLNLAFIYFFKNLAIFSPFLKLVGTFTI